jgi:uncharacterized protein Smg (DUF494 family)
MKNRVLLVFDEFTESEKWQNLLQKMGFAVESIRNEVALVTQLLSLRPDAVFIMGQGSLLNPIRVLERLMSQSWFRGKIIVFESISHPINLNELQGYRFDGLLTMANFSAVERLEILAQALDLDFDFLYQKYVSTFGSEAEPLDGSTRSFQISTSSESRYIKSVEKYKKFKIKRDSSQLATQIDKSELEKKLIENGLQTQHQDSKMMDKKREFVRALFKKS